VNLPRNIGAASMAAQMARENHHLGGHEFEPVHADKQHEDLYTMSNP
jgi:hypothetical protein